MFNVEVSRRYDIRLEQRLKEEDQLDLEWHNAMIAGYPSAAGEIRS